MFSFAQHIETLLGAMGETQSPPLLAFALVDCAQLSGRPARELSKLLADQPHQLLFKDCFAEPALAHSPAWVSLPTEVPALRGALMRLDAICQEHPMLSVVQAEPSSEPLIQQLRMRMRLQADGDEYLLRVADTQTVRAAATALRDDQKAALFKSVCHWWVVDHDGQLTDCARQHDPECEEADELVLDAEQIHALLEASQVALLAAQLRQLDPEFGRRLKPAEQARFVAQGLDEASLLPADDRVEHVFARWYEQRV